MNTVKRFLGILAAIVCVVLLVGCQSDTILITTPGGNKVDVNRSQLGEVRCIGGINAEEDFTLSGDKARELFDLLYAQRSAKAESSNVDGNFIHLTFEAEFNNETATLGVFMVMDNGTMQYSTSLFDDHIQSYTCEKDLYDTVLRMIREKEDKASADSAVPGSNNG